jgi:hypothetical protein
MCQGETRVLSGTARIGVALASGALFGMVMQAALRYVGLDFATVHGNLIAHGAARPGLASWVWWFLAVAIFFVGPLSVVLVRRFIADRRLFCEPWLLLWIMIVLGLVTLVHLAPSRLGMTSAPDGFPVVVLSALLAAIGTRLAWPAEGDRSSGLRSDRASGPFPILRPGRGGSVNSGLPMRGMRRVRSAMSGVRVAANVALAVVTPIAALAAVSAFSGAAIVHELAIPGTIHAPIVKQAIRQAPHIEVLALADEEVLALADDEVLALADEPAGADPRAAVAAIRPERVRAAPPPVRQPAVRQPAVRITALANARVPMSASELTFAKGYAKRRAALQAAKTAQASATPEIKVAAKLASRTERYDRSHRRGANARHGGYHRYASYNRHAGFDRQASNSNRYTDGSNRYTDGFNRYTEGSNRSGGHNRQRTHDRSGGYDRYAHYDWQW